MRAITGVLAAALVLGACSDASEPVPLTDVLSPTPTPSTSAVEATDPDDPYAVPDEITAEYVERVYAALAKLESEAIQAYRAHVEDGGDPALPPKEAVDRFRAIYSEKYFPPRMAAWQETASSDRGFSGFRRDLGEVHIDVSALVHAGPGCIVVRATADFGETAASPPPKRESYYAFVSGETSTLNPTPWELQYSFLATESQSPPEEDPCR